MPFIQKEFNAKEVKEKIRTFLEAVGPSLPLQVSKHIGINTLFASAFLSELSSEGIVRISHMKIGSSPLYFTPSRINMLENFIKFLSGKEKEACLLLKDSQVLQDDIQTPVIRVALRSLKDFAFPFKKENKIFWRYFLITEKQAIDIIEGKEKSIEEIELKEEIILEKPEPVKTILIIEEKRPEIRPIEAHGDSDIIKKIEKELLEKKIELEKARKSVLDIQKIDEEARQNKSPVKERKSKKEAFLEAIKALLKKKNIELLKLDSYDEKKVFAKIRIIDKNYFLAAFNKKKLDYSDLLKASKKAIANNTDYIVFAKGELSKKAKETIEAYKRLANFEIIAELSDSQEQQSF